MLDLYSHSTRVPWSGHFCPTETHFINVLTSVFMIGWLRQNRPLAKKDVRWWAPVKIHHGTCVHQQTMGVMGVYYIMITKEIFEKHTLMAQFSISVAVKTLAALDGTIWHAFDCCSSRRIPADDYGILPRAIQITSHVALLGLPKQQVVENRCKLMHQKGENACLLKITWAQISSWDVRFIFSLHQGALVWALFAPPRHVSSMFWLRFSWSNGSVKIDHLPKRMCADTCLSKYIMGPVFICKPWVEYMVPCEFHDVIAHIAESVSNVKWALNVFS